MTDPSRLPRAPVETPVPAPRAGVVASWNARALGELLVELGGGRRRKEDAVDPAVGIRLLRKTGDVVSAGDAIAIAATRGTGEGAREAILRAVTIAEGGPASSGEPRPVVLEEMAG